MDADKLRELTIRTKQAELNWRKAVAAKSRSAGMAAQTYQMLKIKLDRAQKENK